MKKQLLALLFFFLFINGVYGLTPTANFDILKPLNDAIYYVNAQNVSIDINDFVGTSTGFCRIMLNGAVYANGSVGDSSYVVYENLIKSYDNINEDVYTFEYNFSNGYHNLIVACADANSCNAIFDGENCSYERLNISDVNFSVLTPVTAPEVVYDEIIINDGFDVPNNDTVIGWDEQENGVNASIIGGEVIIEGTGDLILSKDLEGFYISEDNAYLQFYHNNPNMQLIIGNDNVAIGYSSELVGADTVFKAYYLGEGCNNIECGDLYAEYTAPDTYTYCPSGNFVRRWYSGLTRNNIFNGLCYQDDCVGPDKCYGDYCVGEVLELYWCVGTYNSPELLDFQLNQPIDKIQLTYNYTSYNISYLDNVFLSTERFIYGWGIREILNETGEGMGAMSNGMVEGGGIPNFIFILLIIAALVSIFKALELYIKRVVRKF